MRRDALESPRAGRPALRRRAWNAAVVAGCAVSSGAVLVPLALVPLLKSETTLMLFLLVPLAVLALVALRARSLLVKLALLACDQLADRLANEALDRRGS